MSTVSNPASALGEAIGKLIEEAIKQEISEKFIKYHSELQLTSGKLKDSNNIDYDIDMIIQEYKDGNYYPIGLIEVKFLRYKKHMRDKGSWIKSAFAALRETYPTIIFTLAVLVGNWTRGSKDMLKKAGVDIVEIPFDRVVKVFEKYNIDVNWGETERDKAQKAWDAFSKLPDEEKRKIGVELVKDHVNQIIRIVESKYHEIKSEEAITRISILIHTNIGREVRFNCNDISECERIISILKQVTDGKLTVQELVEKHMNILSRKKITDYSIKSS